MTSIEILSTVLLAISGHNPPLLFIIIIYTSLPFIIFDVHLLAGETTTAGDSSLTLAVVRA